MTESEKSFQQLLTWTPEGLYCPAGDFHVDPWRPTGRAVVTHGHSDHARYGCQRYLTSRQSVPILKSRLGNSIVVRGLRYQEELQVGDARVSLFPAGHILGSAQVRIQVGNQVAVVTGDYKRQSDSTCDDFEPIACDLLVTECTFGLPIYRWKDDATLAQEILHWWADNQKNRRPSILYGYALGKSQRLLSMLQPLGPIYLHGALVTPTQIYRQAGVALPQAMYFRDAPQSERFQDAMILAVPSAHGTPWMRRFPNASTAMASGWMQVRGQRRRRSVDRGFVVSDHADWPGLLDTVKQTGARQVWATHGSTDIFARYLTESGIPARPLETHYAGDELADDPSLENGETDDDSPEQKSSPQRFPSAPSPTDIAAEEN